jgi:stress responsive alpha/beta barrel protein
VIQHIVLLKWQAGTTDAQVDDVFARAEELVRGIDGVEQVTLGRNRGNLDHGYTHAFIVSLSDDAALATYLDHPVRDRYLTEVLSPVEEERIEIDVPDDASHRRRSGASRSWEWGATRHSASADAAALRLEEKDGEL